MSITNPQIDNKNKVIQVRRSKLLVCGLSLMIGLSGCSDSGELTQADTGGTQDTSTGTTDNQDNTNQETGDSPATEGNSPSNEAGGGVDQGESESPDNGDSGSAGSDGGSSSGDSSEDSTPTDTSKLHVKFTRPAPVANSAPHIQRQNQELSGRLFQLEVYTIDDQLNLQDVTTEVTWNTISEECNGDPCYTLNSDGKLVAGAKGKFSVQAEYNGLLSSVVNLETPRKLETCGVEGNADKAHRTEQCLHIIVGNSGDADGKWFTEPPRSQVMSYMWYSFDDKMYNSGYTHSGFTTDGGSGTNQFAQMRNDGYDQSIKDAGGSVDEGQYGQHERYCADLSAIKFNGRDNWRKPTLDELTELSTMSIGATYDWPIYGSYSSGMPHMRGDANGGLHYISVVMSTGQNISLLPEKETYPTCLSVPVP